MSMENPNPFLHFDFVISGFIEMHFVMSGKNFYYEQSLDRTKKSREQISPWACIHNVDIHT